MSREKKYREPVTPRDVLIPLGVGLVLGIVIFVAQGGFRTGDKETLWRAVCDALTYKSEEILPIEQVQRDKLKYRKH